MPGERHPVDLLTDDLTRTYSAGARRLELIVAAGLRRGLDPSRAGGLDAKRGDASIAYRERQLGAARAVLGELRRNGAQQAGLVAARAYGAGLLAVDRTALAGAAELAPRFGGIHARAVEVLAGNMTSSLNAAIDRAGDNVERVFERASAIERGLPVRGGPLPGGNFIGRRVNDPWRRVALDTIGEGLVTLDTRRQVSAAMVRRLLNEGVSDALTGYVDKAGRRWSLDRYAAMAARTTTREAASAATVNRMTEHGLDLVTISSHAHQADECTPYDGGTFSLDGATPGYEVLDQTPPFHSFCVHVLTPAAANFDEYLDELERAAAEGGVPVDDPPIDVPDTGPAARPAKLTPEQKIGELATLERAAALDRAIDRATSTTAERRAALRERYGEEGDDPAGILHYEREARRQYAEHGGRPPWLPAGIDEEGIRNVGAKVRALVDRRRNASRRKFDAAAKARLDKTDELYLAIDKRISAGESYEDLTTELDRVIQAGYGEVKAHRDEVAAIMLDTLRAVRPGYGEGRARGVRYAEDVDAVEQLVHGRSRFDAPPAVARELGESLDEATAYLPREWVEDSNELGALEVRASVDRAHYSAGGGYLRVRPSDRSVMLHELGHRIEHARPALRWLEAEFYRRRTSRGGRQEKARPLSELTGWAGYSDDELARKDRFTNAYIGKDYSRGGRGPGASNFYEVLTMGLEGVFHGKHDVTNDRDLVEFIYGLLAAG